MTRASIPSPARLRAASHLYGIEAPSAMQARVLALGLSVEQDLLPYAASYPQAETLGIDLDPEQVERDRARVEAAGIAVGELSRTAGVKYNNGESTVTYFSMVLFGE